MKKWLQNNRVFFFLCLIIGVVHIGLVVYYGMQKEGFHEDELYSFATSAGEMMSTPRGNYIWKTGYQLQQEFMVMKENPFAFDQVIQNQAEDVHPPLFYLALNVIMSLFPESFYKWFGIGLNLVYSLITYGGILFFFSRLDKNKLDKGRQNGWCALIAGAVYAASPAMISNVMLVRMYALSGMWNILYACIFLLLIQEYSCSRKRFVLYTLAGAIICYLAFLTHYFALLLPFFFTLGYGVYSLLQKKRVLRMFLYGVSMLAAVGAAVWTYPASIQHIFFGYRGAGVQDSLAHAELIGMTKTFLIILNDRVFAGMLLPITLLMTGVAVALSVAFLNRRTRKKAVTEEKEAGVPFFTKQETYVIAVSFIACLISVYFLTKSALLVGDASCRFFYPVLAFMLPLSAYWTGKSVFCLLKQLAGWKRLAARMPVAFLKRYLPIVLSVLLLLPGMVGFVRGDVLFLYPENAKVKELLSPYQDYPAVIIYDQSNPYRSWYVADQLWGFSKIYYLDGEHFQATFQDEILEKAQKVVVYVDAPAEYLEKLQEMNPALDHIQQLWKTDYFYIYGVE